MRFRLRYPSLALFLLLLALFTRELRTQKCLVSKKKGTLLLHSSIRFVFFTHPPCSFLPTLPFLPFLSSLECGLENKRGGNVFKVFLNTDTIITLAGSSKLFFHLSTGLHSLGCIPFLKTFQ